MLGANRLAELAFVLRDVREFGQRQLGVVGLPGDDSAEGFLVFRGGGVIGTALPFGTPPNAERSRAGLHAGCLERVVPLHHAVRRRLQVLDVDDGPQGVVADRREGLADKLGEFVRGDLVEVVRRFGPPGLNPGPVVGDADAHAADVEVQGAHVGEQLFDAVLLGAVSLG